MKDSDLGAGRPNSFASALAAAIERRAVPLTWLRDRLAASGNPVSLATLSYWRSGRRTPEGPASMAAIAELESLLELPAGELADRVGPHRRVGPLPRPADLSSDPTLQAAFRETLEALAATPLSSAVRDLTTHVVVDVDERGDQRRQTVRSLVQVTQGVVAEVPYIQWVNEPVDTIPTFSAVAGCRLDRTHTHAGRQVFGAVFVLDAPVEQPQRTVIEVAHDYPPGFPHGTECAHALTRRGRETLLWVRFHPDRLPRWAEEYELVDGEEERFPREVAGRSLFGVRRSFGPGEFGLRWRF